MENQTVSDIVSDESKTENIALKKGKHDPDWERRRKKKLLKAKDYTVNILITVIPFVGFLIFGIVPMVMSLVISFSELHTSQLADAIWIGFKNYIDIFSGQFPEIGYAYLNTLIYLVNVPLGLILNVLVANLINKATFGKKFARFVYFIPYVCSTVALSFMFQLLYRENGGVFNNILNLFGFESVRWLAQSPVSFMLCTALVTMWAGSGFSIVLLGASLAKVDKTYYEAADLDGAGEFTKFWRITLPAVTPTLSYLLTMALIGSIQVMSEPMILAGEIRDTMTYWVNAEGEHVANGTFTAVYQIYNMAFENSYTYGFGIASACAWVLTVVILLVTRLNLRLQRRWVCYDF